ncbi:hypothetical protein C8R43DRAFT_1032016 [Mycena crocata]|nr:hypothetical protein C8R43DRAFT_1032016 [Mycena crocata]
MNFLSKSFLPVHGSPPAAELKNHSMVIGGSILHLKPDEAWPICTTCAHPLVPLIQMNISSENTPEAFRSCFPSAMATGETLATMVQLFVCPEDGCYDNSTLYSTDTRSWLLRVAHVPLGIQDVDAGRVEARDKIEQGPGFLPVRFVESWVEGKEETLDQELLWDQDDSEDFYAAHEPQPGLKLLGHSVRGKYYFSDDSDCPKGGPHEHPTRRELIQPGDRNFEWEQDDALGMMATIGNTWIEQCAIHSEVLTLSMSGNW